MGPWVEGLNELKNKYKKTKINGEDTYPYFNYKTGATSFIRSAISSAASLNFARSVVKAAFL